MHFRLYEGRKTGSTYAAYMMWKVVTSTRTELSSWDGSRTTIQHRHAKFSAANSDKHSNVLKVDTKFQLKGSCNIFFLIILLDGIY